MPDIINDEGEVIAHYGVKGMQWGVRRALTKGGAAGLKVNRGVNHFVHGKKIGDKLSDRQEAAGDADLAKAGKAIKAMRKSKGYSDAKKALVIDEQHSLLTKQGRENFKGDVEKGKGLLKRLVNSKAFKATIYNHEGTLAAIEKGKKTLENKKAQLSRDKAVRKKARAEATRKLIDDLVKGDQKNESSALFGNKFSEQEARAYWEKLFEKDLAEA